MLVSPSRLKKKKKKIGLEKLPYSPVKGFKVVLWQDLSLAPSYRKDPEYGSQCFLCPSSGITMRKRSFLNHYSENLVGFLDGQAPKVCHPKMWPPKAPMLFHTQAYNKSPKLPIKCPYNFTAPGASSPVNQA